MTAREIVQQLNLLDYGLRKIDPRILSDYDRNTELPWALVFSGTNSEGKWQSYDLIYFNSYGDFRDWIEYIALLDSAAQEEQIARYVGRAKSRAVHPSHPTSRAGLGVLQQEIVG